MNDIRDSGGVSPELELRSQERQLEELLRQGQWNESFRSLARGIAHNLNNALTPLVGYTEIGLESAAPDDPLRFHLEQIAIAGNRARDMVRQILECSRPADALRVPVRLALVVEAAAGTLRRMLPGPVALHLEIDRNCVPVRGDPVQLHQLVLLLSHQILREILPGGGTLELGLRSTAVGDRPFVRGERALHLWVRGTCASRNGTAHAEARRLTVARNCRDCDRRLSMVHRVVAGHGGEVFASLDPGRGLIYDLYLPRDAGSEAA